MRRFLMELRVRRDLIGANCTRDLRRREIHCEEILEELVGLDDTRALGPMIAIPASSASMTGD
jgi:hypothetical protein